MNNDLTDFVSSADKLKIKVKDQPSSYTNFPDLPTQNGLFVSSEATLAQKVHNKKSDLNSQETKKQFKDTFKSKLNHSGREYFISEEKTILIETDEKQRLFNKVDKVNSYWKKESFLIPNVFRLAQLCEDDNESLVEYQDLSKKELLVQSNGQKSRPPQKFNLSFQLPISEQYHRKEN